MAALSAIEHHPHARAVLEPALAGGSVSHAYLFHGPGGTGKRAAARALAAELLVAGSPDEASARARVESGAHPDLTWVTPSGAHELLVSDIAEPVVAAASRTPFESSRRVFVIERVDTLNDESANRMLKTLEEPAPYVHLILLTDRLSEVLPTIASRCQLVRFDALGGDEIAAALSSREGVAEATARACARLALGDGDVATALASGEGAQLREAAEGWARAVLAGRAAERPWDALLALCRARGAAAEADVDAALEDALGVAARGEQSRLKTEFSERRRRMKRRAETAALDLGLQLVGQWLRDVACVCWEADEVVRNLDRLEALREDAEGRDGAVLRAGVELVEQTRLRLQFNVGEALACEALAYRLEELLAR